MSDTLGNIIDKLVTVDVKMWNNQELDNGKFLQKSYKTY
jgi:hypothetical protein